MESEAQGRSKSATGQAAGGPLKAPIKVQQPAQVGQSALGQLRSPIKIKQPAEVGQSSIGQLRSPIKNRQAAARQAPIGPLKGPIKVKQPEAGGSGGCIFVNDAIKASGGRITMCMDCGFGIKLAAGSNTTGASGGTETAQAKDSAGASTSRAIEAAEAVTSDVIKEAGEVASSSGGSNAVTVASPGSAPKAEGPEIYDIKEVAKSFITSYYKVLQNGPQYLFRFHGDDTEFCHGSIQLPGVVGIEKIKERLTLLNYANSRVEIRSLDAFESVNKTITVLVLGQMTIKYAYWRPFVHTMILVLREPNTQKYYLKTDSLRFLI